jgi:formylmethanofuran dehydrogenase subunit E
MHILDDKELVDPPEKRSFICEFCDEETPTKYHNELRDKDCCDMCLEDIELGEEHESSND